MLRTWLCLALLALPAPAAPAPDTETFGGVGISLGLPGGSPTALAVMPGSPAGRAGIKPGDRIRKLDGQSLAGLTLEQVVKKVRGPVGSQLKLSLVRDDDPKTLEVILTRETIKQDPASQFALARQGAEKGFPDSQANLGFLYYKGQGTARDYDQALHWLRQAASGGSASACFYIGLMSYHGEGLPQSPTEAYYWWRQAAERGFPGAQHNLGHLYFSGEGVTRDLVQSYRWYWLASQGGIESAAKNLEKVEATMTPDQLAAARALTAPAPAAAAEGKSPQPSPPAKPQALSAEDLKALDDQLLP
ncbi:MAG: PDZ domain-containing protein [Elusimicrobiota bacterium]|jgi:hypothetical protein